MNSNLEIIINKLQELRIASINSNANTIRETMHKYDMLFLGKDFNTIYSVELHHSMKNKFNIDIPLSELNSLIPTACTALKMSYEKLVALEDLDKPNPAIDYQIVLWK